MVTSTFFHVIFVYGSRPQLSYITMKNYKRQNFFHKLETSVILICDQIVNNISIDKTFIIYNITYGNVHCPLPYFYYPKTYT